MEKESSLLNEIERLELANEQLIQGAPDSDLQQLQMEVLESSNPCTWQMQSESFESEFQIFAMIATMSAVCIDRHQHLSLLL